MEIETTIATTAATTAPMFDEVTGLLNGLDISNLLPKLDSVLGYVDAILRIAVLLAPVVIFALGLAYFLTPPKEANHGFGYRFYWGMSSVESWAFTQKLAGIVWAVLGLVLIIVMAILCSGFAGMELMAMVEKAVTLLIWELALVAVSCIAIDITVVVMFDRKGVRRFGKKN